MTADALARLIEQRPSLVIDLDDEDMPTTTNADAVRIDLTVRPATRTLRLEALRLFSRHFTADAAPVSIADAAFAADGQCYPVEGTGIGFKSVCRTGVAESQNP